MKKTIPQVIGITVLSLFLFWLPLMLKTGTFWGIEFGRQGMEVVVQNFDGLNFLVVAKSLYSPQIIEEINAQFLTGNEPIYFSAHYPLMAIIIRIFSTFLSLPNALLATIVISNILLGYGLLRFFTSFGLNQKLTVLLTTMALFFPARMLSVRGVGSNEPLFIFFILMSLVANKQKRDYQSALWGTLAVLTRSPGILLFGGYAISILLNKSDWPTKIMQALPYLLMPLTLLSLFAYYGYIYGDFWAYFNSGDNLHLFFPPFAIFSNMQSWISDMWREDIIYLYLFYGGGLLLLPKKYTALRMFTYVYGTTLLLVAHRDLARYALPIAPMVWLGYERVVAQIPTQYRRYLWLALIPIYLLGWQFVLKNIQPIGDWSVFL